MVGSSEEKLLRHFGPLGRGAGTAIRRRNIGAEKVLSPAKSAVVRPAEVESTITKSK